MSATQNFRIRSFILALAIKAPVRTFSTGPLTLSGLQSVNGVLLTPQDRILVKDQADPIENGVYAAQTSAWIRDGDFDGDRDVVGGTIVPAYRASDGEIVLFIVDGQPLQLTPDVDAITFSVYFDQGALPETDTLQTVTARGNTTDQGIDITTGEFLTLFEAGDVDNVTLDVNDTIQAPNTALAFTSSANVDGYNFDELVNIDTAGVFVGPNGRLAFYRAGDAISSYIGGDSVTPDIEIISVTGDVKIGPGATQYPLRWARLADFAVEHQIISSAAGVFTWDYSLGQSARAALFENITSVVFTNVPFAAPSQQLAQLELDLSQAGAGGPWTVAWPASVLWPGGTAPDLSTAGSRHLITLRTFDAGTTWLGNFAENYA